MGDVGVSGRLDRWRVGDCEGVRRRQRVTQVYSSVWSISVVARDIRVRHGSFVMWLNVVVDAMRLI